jgi:hypothetical protein
MDGVDNAGKGGASVRQCVNEWPYRLGRWAENGTVIRITGGYKSFRFPVVVVFVGSRPSSQLSPSPSPSHPHSLLTLSSLRQERSTRLRPSSATTNSFHPAPSPTLYQNPPLHLVTPRSPCRSAGTTSGCPFCSTTQRVPLSCAYSTISCD